MAKQHFSVLVPNTTAFAGLTSGSSSTQFILGLTGSAGYLSFLAFVVLRIAAV